MVMKFTLVPRTSNHAHLPTDYIQLDMEHAHSRYILYMHVNGHQLVLNV